MDLLLAFNTGDISTMERLRPQWEQQADLKARQLELRQKISLLALMEVCAPGEGGRGAGAGRRGWERGHYGYGTIDEDERWWKTCPLFRGLLMFL